MLGITRRIDLFHSSVPGSHDSVTESKQHNNRNVNTVLFLVRDLELPSIKRLIMHGDYLS